MTSSARRPPSRPSPAKRGKETLPHAGKELLHAISEQAYCSVFLPHVWGRIEVGDKRPRLRAVPHPGLPPQSGGRRRCHIQVRSCYMQFQSEHIAASSSPIYGGGLRWGTNGLALMETEVGGKRLICALSPIPAFPRKRGKETLPHAGKELLHAISERAYCSVFLPHLWGRTEVGGKRPRT